MGRRGPRPTPTAHLRLVGSRELEHRHDEPKPELGAPSPPAWLSREAMAEWRRVVPELTRIGVLAKVDRAVLVAYCESWALFTAAQRTTLDRGITQKNRDGLDIPAVHVRVLNDTRAAFLRFAQELGLSPSARVRMTTQAKVDSDPLGAFVKDRKA